MKTRKVCGDVDRDQFNTRSHSEGSTQSLVRLHGKFVGE